MALIINLTSQCVSNSDIIHVKDFGRGNIPTQTLVLIMRLES